MRRRWRIRFVQAGRFLVASCLCLAACQGPGDPIHPPVDGSTDARPEDDTATLPDVAVRDAPGHPGDAAGDGAAEVPPDADFDATPLPPIFGTGLVVPLDSIPCLAADGSATMNCNHHGSTVAVAKDGTVLAAWYQGRGEYSADSRIVWSRRPPGGDFGPWQTLLDEPGVPEGNPVLTVDDRSGEWWLFYVRVVGTSWNDGQIRMIRSRDRGASWDEPRTLREETHWMTRNHPLRRSGGEWILPCYNETLFVPTFLISPDGFATDPEEVEPPPDTLLLYLGQIQPSIVERPDGSLFALMRNGNGPFRGHAIEATSADGGRLWTEGTASPIPNPGAALEMTRLRSGAVMAVFDNSPTDRLPLAVALSDDDGASWSAVANVVAACETGECSYPSIASDPTDGSAWITYTHARRSIGWVHVSEAWVRAKGYAFAPID